MSTCTRIECDACGPNTGECRHDPPPRVAGAAVAVVSRSVDELTDTVDLIEAAGGTAAGVAADVADAGELAAAVTDLRRRLGPIDLLVNTQHEHRIREWTLNELAEGRGAEPAHAVELIMRLAIGDGDSLTGRHLSVHDDLDAVLTRRHEVRARDLYVLRPSRLDDDAHPVR